MTPVELIALTGCSRPEDGRGCRVCLAAAEHHLQAVERAGLVVAAVRDEELESLRELAADYARIVARLQDAADLARTLAGEHAECDGPCWEHMPAIVAALDASLPPEEETEIRG